MTENFGSFYFGGDEQSYFSSIASVFIVHLFIIAKKGKHPKCVSTVKEKKPN
jgi:hypothetical protein